MPTTYYGNVFRNTPLSLIAEYTTKPPFANSTNIGMRAFLQNTRWYRQVDYTTPLTGTFWTIEKTYGTTNIGSVTNVSGRNLCNQPFAWFDLFGTVVTETGVEHNYGGWQINDSIQTFSNYSRNLGSSYGVPKWKGYNASGKFYGIRQFAVNETRDQIAVRFNPYDSSTGLYTTSTGSELQYITIGRYYPTSNSTTHPTALQNLTPTFAGNFDPGNGDLTSVWLFNVASVASYSLGLGNTALICEFSN